MLKVTGGISKWRREVQGEIDLEVCTVVKMPEDIIFGESIFATSRMLIRQTPRSVQQGSDGQGKVRIWAQWNLRSTKSVRQRVKAAAM
jgi:hypothetical protein